MTDNIYKTPESNVETEVLPVKASKRLKIICFCLAFALLVIGGIQQFIATGGRLPESIGGAVGGIIWPLLVVALFQIGRGFRNERSRYTIFAWTALVFFLLVVLGLIGSYLSMLKAS